MDKLPKCKIIIVDDLPENQIALHSLLKEEDADIFLASSGLEALDLLLKHEFALALVDVQMPEMDGFELAEIMRSTDRTRNIPLIFVTAAGNDEERVFQGYEKGAVDFLHKPLSPYITLSKVRIFLQLQGQKSLLEKKISELERTQSELNKALKSRDEFLSICSHELKTPLTSLKMQIQIVNRLREKKGDEIAFAPLSMQKFLSQADRSVERIIHLVNDMLDISRVSTGRLTLNREHVEVDKLIHDIAERLQSFMEMANCELQLNIPKNITGLWDKFRVEQVITNLLTNAAKYAPDHPVEVNVRKHGSFAEIQVKDHGEGISPQDQKRIFDRFERAVSAHSVSGLGLGLYISKQIVELHHGTIAVDSTLGKGTTFSVRLPIF